MGQRDQTHCKRGHEFTADNTRWGNGAGRQRFCRQCHRDRVQGAAYRALKRAYDARPERAAVRAARDANRRAEMLGTPGRITAIDVLAVWSAQPRCLSCGDGYGLDHVQPLGKGGTNALINLQNLCVSCNSRKAALMRWAA